MRAEPGPAGASSQPDRLLREFTKAGLAMRHVFNFHINLIYNSTGETQPNVLQLHKENT